MKGKTWVKSGWSHCLFHLLKTSVEVWVRVGSTCTPSQWQVGRKLSAENPARSIDREHRCCWIIDTAWRGWYCKARRYYSYYPSQHTFNVCTWEGDHACQHSCCLNLSWIKEEIDLSMNIDSLFLLRFRKVTPRLYFLFQFFPLTYTWPALPSHPLLWCEMRKKIFTTNESMRQQESTRIKRLCLQWWLYDINMLRFWNIHFLSHSSVFHITHLTLDKETTRLSHMLIVAGMPTHTQSHCQTSHSLNVQLYVCRIFN